MCCSTCTSISKQAVDCLMKSESSTSISVSCHRRQRLQCCCIGGFSFQTTVVTSARQLGSEEACRPHSRRRRRRRAVATRSATSQQRARSSGCLRSIRIMSSVQSMCCLVSLSRFPWVMLKWDTFLGCGISRSSHGENLFAVQCTMCQRCTCSFQGFPLQAGSA